MHPPSALITLLLTCAIALAQTGTPVPALSGLDNLMQQALSRYGVKGGALAVVKDGHLVFARGYGFADAEAQQPVQPDSLFRWCSISKTVTAAAVMRLVEDRKLDLDAPVFTILDQYTPYNGRWGDYSLRTITVRQLLHHTGGWDRITSPLGDPVVAEGTVKASQTTGTAFPPTLDTVIRYMLAQRLDFAPGSRFAYSNFGYELVQRVIEKASGQSYLDFVRQQVLDPAGLPRVQKGSPHLAGRLPGEVKYYDYPGAPLLNSYVSAAREKQPAPYGIMNTDLAEAAGAWVGSAVDLAKFASLLDGFRPRSLLTPASFNVMIEEQPRNLWVDAYGWYGFGLFVQPQPIGLCWDHSGYNPGSQTNFYRFGNRVLTVYLFNGATQDASNPATFLGQTLYDTLMAVREWPTHDLFPQYYPPRITAAGIVNAASFRPGPLAPESLITILGSDLGGLDAPATASLRDSSGSERPIEILYSDPGQLNAIFPADSAPGDYTLLVRRPNWPDAQSPLTVAPVSPGLFTLNASGLLAASLVRTKPRLPQSWEPVYQLDAAGNILARPIVFGEADEDLSLVVYCTGVRGRTALSTVNLHLSDLDLAPAYAGPQLQYPGLDQVNVHLPRSLAGAGPVNIRLEIENSTSNTATLTFR